MKSSKICLIVYKYLPEWAGVAKSASRLVKYLVEQGLDVHVVVPTIYNSRMEIATMLNTNEIDNHGAKIYRPSVNNDSLMGDLLEFIKLLDIKTKFDLFHGYWLPLAFPCLLIAENGKRPIIASIRGNDAFKEGVSLDNFGYVNSVLNKATWITSVCTDLLCGLNGIVDITNRSSVIFNGIDTSGIPHWKGYHSSKGVVGTAGELRFKKAIPDLVNAYNELPKNIRKSLILCGSFSCSNEEKEVSRLVQCHSLEKEVENTGFMERKALLDKIRTFNVFVINSYHDGLPNTLLEAAACGIPIIASNVGGMADVLFNYENALIIEPGNIKQLTSAIETVLTDEKLSNKLSGASLELAKKLSFDFERQQWLNLYQDLLSQKNNSNK